MVDNLVRDQGVLSAKTNQSTKCKSEILRVQYLLSFLHLHLRPNMGSANSVGGIAIRLRAGPSGLRIPACTRDFLFSKDVHTGCGVNPAAYSLGTGVPFRGYASEVHRSPPSSGEFGLRVSMPLLTPFAFRVSRGTTVHFIYSIRL